MKETKQTIIFLESQTELKPLSVRALLTELAVQFWQTITDLHTTYARAVWLKQRQRTRLSLLELSDEQLKDIGIKREDANQEGNKFFWE